MTTGVFQNLRKLISVVDELRDVGLQQFINLPRIVVVGTQSAGKSSVLEGVVGLDFLPRGEGVVTRRPLELRLVHNSAHAGTVARFEGSDAELTDMPSVCAEISRLTDQVAGRNKGIVDTPIVLTITGPECPDLTLVDLPGITRVPLRNSDQTDDIELLTREMSRRYVEDPRTIILAVIPANQDISTSDALQLARKVDPRGLRTIGVITKLDLMDPGTNAAKMISGEDIPLRLGYVAVKNRSQADIQEHKSVKASSEDELSWFKSHPVYKQMGNHLFGMRNLTDKLTRVLFKHIHNFLPQIKLEISNKQREIKIRLQELGEGIPQDANQRTQLIWSMINDFCESFTNVIRGKYDKRLSTFVDPETNARYGGSQIRRIFTDLLKQEATQAADVAAGRVSAPNSGGGLLGALGFGSSTTGTLIDMTDVEIDQAIRLHEGDSLPGFPTPDTFEFLILPYLQKLHFPVLECLDQVTYTLDQLLQHLSGRVFARFPSLGSEVLNLSRELLERQKETTRQMLDSIVNAETGYMFTNDDSYLAAHGAMLASTSPQVANAPQQPAPHGTVSVAPDQAAKPQPGGVASNTLQHIQNTFWRSSVTGQNGAGAASAPNGTTQYSLQYLQEIRARLNSYYSIILRNIRDTAPRTIGHFLVRNMQEHLQYELYSSVANNQTQESLLGEPDAIVEEREALRRQQRILSQAAIVLQRDPSITALIAPHAAAGEFGFDDQFDWDLRNAGKDNPATSVPINVNQPFNPASSMEQLPPPASGSNKPMKLALNLHERAINIFDMSGKKASAAPSPGEAVGKCADPLFDN